MDRRDLADCDKSEALWDWNLLTNRVHFSPRWFSMLGCEEHEASNAPEEWFRRIHPDDVQQVESALQAHLADHQGEFETQHRMRHKDGTYLWTVCRCIIRRGDDGQPTRIAGYHSDITGGKVADALTALPNRLLLLDRMKRSIDRAKKHNDFVFAVLLIDLDRFKSLNERLGPTAGDRLLIAAARRLEKYLRTAAPARDYLVARLEKDEFTILLDGLNEMGEAKVLAEGLITNISAPFELDGHEAFVTASCGIALSATGYDAPDDVLRDADIALYRAKSLGRARCEIFDTAILESAQKQRQLESDLERAIERQEFSVFYQPIVSLASNQIAGFEALLRWNHPVRGTVPPLEFIPIAERTGFIVPLGQWVLEQSCRQLKAWRDNLAAKQLWVSVNLSSIQFKQRTLGPYIDELLRGAGLDPRSLLLELTESAVVENPEAARSLLIKLQVMGARIALDDFGAGYSSLSYLRELPLDFIKIDRAFIRGIENSADGVEIVRTITALAHQLNLQVIAEGIENPKQLEIMKSLDCEFGQGFLFSPPVASEKAAELLQGESVQRHGRSGKDPEEQPALTSSEVHSPVGGSEDILARQAGQRKRRMLRRRMAPLYLVLGSISLVCLAAMVHSFNLHLASPSSQLTTVEAVAPAPRAAIEQPESVFPEDVKSLFQNEDLKSVPVGEPSIVPPQTKRNAGAIPARIGAAALPARRVTSNAGTGRVETTSLVRDALNYNFSVLHYHRLGSCKGNLRVTRDVVTYIPEREGDAFTFNHHAYSYGLADDRLVIKSDSRSYRFKSMSAGSKEENRSELQEIMRALDSAHQK